MRQFSKLFGLLLLSLAALAPSLPAAQDKKVEESKTEVKKSGGYAADSKAKPDWSIDFAGKLSGVSETEDGALTFTVQVQYKYPELNTDVQRQIAQHQQTLLQQQVQLLQAKSLQQRQGILGQMVNTQRQIEQSLTQLYRVKDVNFDVKCRAADGMRVRRFEPPLPIDPETGEFVKLTKEKLEEARGKEGYPGYKADTKILANGQLVNVYVWKDTKTPASLLEQSKLAKKKIEDVRAELKDFRYDVIMVFVVVDVPSAQDQ